MRMTLGMVRGLLTEAPLPLKEPKTPEQKKAMLELVKWAAEKMGAGPEDVQPAFEKAEHDDWSEAMDLLRTFYMMKGIKVKQPARN